MKIKLIKTKFLFLSFIGCFSICGMLRKFPVKTLIMDKKHLRSVTISVDDQDELGRTPLHLAVLEDNTNDVKVLLSRGALLTATDLKGLTPLDYASNDDKLTSVRNFFSSLNLKLESRL